MWGPRAVGLTGAGTSGSIAGRAPRRIGLNSPNSILTEQGPSRDCADSLRKGKLSIATSNDRRRSHPPRAWGLATGNPACPSRHSERASGLCPLPVYGCRLDAGSASLDGLRRAGHPPFGEPLEPVIRDGDRPLPSAPGAFAPPIPIFSFWMSCRTAMHCAGSSLQARSRIPRTLGILTRLHPGGGFPWAV